MTAATINQRSQQILKILVERYIQDGFPVGSRTIADDASLSLSPATIRNILADLEERGYLASPHTSAGRVPTSQGYRFFVNSLLAVRPLELSLLEDQNLELNPDLALPNLLESASVLLSGLTKMIGVVAHPKRNQVTFRQVEFLSLSHNRILVIFVLNNREVQNRIIYTDKVYSEAELQSAANFLNQHYMGKDLVSSRKELHDAMQQEKLLMADLLRTALEIANDTCLNPEGVSRDYVMAGQNHLVNYTKKGEIETLHNLFQAFTQKQDILNLLNHSMAAEGIQIFIGQESGSLAFDDCSIVTTSYAVDGHLIGSLGVIGPSRMPYDKVISAVDITARLLAAALNQD